MSKIRLKKHQKVSILRKTLADKISAAELENDECFKISFKHLDIRQGQTPQDWESKGMLGATINTLAGFCKSPLKVQLDKKFTIYGSFPPQDKTAFYHPEHVPEDAEWARIHVNGKHCVAGHVVRDTFYVVFLDEDHKFYVSELKHT